MKLKKYLSSLLALAMFASCSNDGILDNTNDGDTPEGAVAFSVNFPGRTFQPTTYGDAQPITQGTLEALDKEKSLEGGVFICVFENTDTNKPGKLVSVEKVDLATSETTALETTGVGGKFFIRGMFDEFAQLVAVANLNNAETELKALIGKPFSDVANLLVKQEPGAAKNFTMVSNPVKVKIPRVETPTTTSISFLLERLAVRIDFKNELKPVVGTSVFSTTTCDVRTTIGALNQSYLINTLETPLADSDQKGTKYVYRNYWKRLVFDNSKEAKAQLYTYENGKDEFSLSVKAFTTGGSIAFDIPFNKPLVRNTRYLVTLKNGVGGAITHSIQVLPWKDGEDMVISANELRDKPVVTKLSVADNSGEVSNSPVQHALTGDLANLSKITLNTREAYDLRLVVKSNVVPKIEAKGLLTPWMQITEKSASSETVDNSEVKVYHLHFAQNDDSYKREARIVLYTDGNYDNPEKNRIIEIEQKETGYNDILNPLALFSNAVVDTPNKFAKPATFENIGSPEVRGKQYQWGRNIPFDPYGAIDIQRKKVLSTNAVDVKANYYIPGVYNWHTDEFGNKKWADVVKQLPSPENDDYIGNNDGDPSPEGWKLPSLAQSRAIFLDGFYYYWTSSGVDKIISPLKVDIKKDGEANYKATFKKDNTKGILYTLLLEGISSENTDDKYLTAFRYEWNKEVGLIIKARHIGIVAPISSKPTITQIANEDWWNDKAEKGYGSEVVRIYPKTKLLNGDYDEIICFYCNDLAGGLGANQDWVRIGGPYNDINAYNLISIIDKDKQP